VDPTLVVLSASFLAAATAALGALPLVGRESVPSAWIGWANALAGGLMLGSAYVLSETGIRLDPLTATLGAAIGVLFTYGTHRAADVEDLDLNKLDETEPTYGAKVLLVSFLHSASEGVAIGVAMAVDLSFGVFLAVAIAVHNIPEATILCAVLRSRGVRLALGSALSVAMNSGQVLLAVSVYAVVTAAPAATPAVLGFGFGALVYLVLVEMLPESYRQAGTTTIAVLTSLAMGVLILLHGTIG
jgi:zinc transporter ZupT